MYTCRATPSKRDTPRVTDASTFFSESLLVVFSELSRARVSFLSLFHRSVRIPSAEYTKMSTRACLIVGARRRYATKRRRFILYTVLHPQTPTPIRERRPRVYPQHNYTLFRLPRRYYASLVFSFFFCSFALIYQGTDNHVFERFRVLFSPRVTSPCTQGECNIFLVTTRKHRMY